MDANLEARKLSIVEYLVELEDEAILQQIERLLKPKVDFWEDLSDKQRQSIQRGLKQLKNGERVDYTAFIARYKAKRMPLQMKIFLSREAEEQLDNLQELTN